MPTQKYSQLLESLYKMDGVRYAAVLNQYGERVSGGMKSSVKSLTPTNLDERLEIQAVLTLRMAEGFAKFTGKLMYATFRWPKAIALFFILNEEKALSLTLDGDFSPKSILSINNAVKKWKSKHSKT